jgi:hypothetical protein
MTVGAPGRGDRELVVQHDSLTQHRPRRQHEVLRHSYLAGTLVCIFNLQTACQKFAVPSHPRPRHPITMDTSDALYVISGGSLSIT